MAVGQAGALATADLAAGGVLASTGALTIVVAGGIGGGGVADGFTTAGAVTGVVAARPLYAGRTLPSGPIDWATPLADTKIPRLRTSTAIFTRHVHTHHF